MNSKRPFWVFIPARYDSTRLPGKILLDIGGKLMVQRAFECAQQSAAVAVVVATDDARIADAVKDFGGKVAMTGKHNCGSDRIAEAVKKLNIKDEEIIVNVQGDEPEMPAELINQVAELAAQDTDIATAATPIKTKKELQDPAVVKVITDQNNFAIYFSRAPITDADAKHAHRHLGIYAYRAGYLKKFAAYERCAAEMTESLEQLRALHYGDKIACVKTLAVPGAAIDTPEDLARVRAQFEKQ